MTANPKELATERPAETTTIVVGAVLILINAVFDLSADVQYALFVLLAFVPTAVTWLVETIRGKK